MRNQCARPARYRTTRVQNWVRSQLLHEAPRAGCGPGLECAPAWGEASAQGSCPVASSQSTTPKDHTSDFSLYDCERSTSGAHHCNAGRTSTVSMALVFRLACSQLGNTQCLAQVVTCC